MWLAATVVLQLALLAAATLIGQAVFSFTRTRPRQALWFAPAVGLAVILHAAALLGWTLGFPKPISRIVFGTLLLLAAWRLRHDPERLARKAWLLLPAAAAGAWPLGSSLFQFGTFNPLNDIYTYLVQARWLQTHPFREPAALDLLHPALTQVTFYQTGHHRMGASFLLAWIQSLTGAANPEDVYPALVALALTAGGLTLAGLIPKTHLRLRVLISLLPALTLSGITFGAVHGFLPQTLGLLCTIALIATATAPSIRAATSFGAALSIGAATVRERIPSNPPTASAPTPTRTATDRERAPSNTPPATSPPSIGAATVRERAPSNTPPKTNPTPEPAASLPPALLLSAQILTYPEALPFTLCALLPFLTRRVIQQTLLLAALFSAPILPNLVQSLAYQVQARSGVNSPFTAHEALEHATGFNAGPWQDRMALLLQPHLNLLACLAVLTLAAWNLRSARKLAPPLKACAAMITALALAWTWFRFFTPNPWDGTPGDPWRQARAATYAAYPALALIVAGLAARPRLATPILAVWLTAGAIQNYRLAAPRLSTLQEELACTTDCGQRLEAFRRTAAPGPIPLDQYDDKHTKLRRYLTYLLMDHPLQANWANDDYIAPHLPKPNKAPH